MQTVTVEKKKSSYEKKIESLVGCIPDDGIDSVKQIRELRWELSKKIKTYEDIERMQESIKKRFRFKA